MDLGVLDLLDDQGNLEGRVLERQVLPSDLSLLGSLEIQAHHHHQMLEVLALLEVLLNLFVLYLL